MRSWGAFATSTPLMVRMWSPTCSPVPRAAALGRISNTTAPVQNFSVRSLKPKERSTRLGITTTARPARR